MRIVYTVRLTVNSKATAVYTVRLTVRKMLQRHVADQKMGLSEQNEDYLAGETYEDTSDEVSYHTAAVYVLIPCNV